MKNQKGSTLIEVVVALALLGIIAGAFLSALATTSSSRTVSTEHAAGRILAASQMDMILNLPYSSTNYEPFALPPEYDGYAMLIDVHNMFDGNLQKITITVKHNDKDVTKLESYKVIR